MKNKRDTKNLKNITYVENPIRIEEDGTPVFTMSWNLENDDWIGRKNGSRERELKIHDELAAKYEKEREDNERLGRTGKP